jgi:hypothetical protein
VAEENTIWVKHTLSDHRFQRELHRLLWTPASSCEGEFDAGWNCRDHGIIVGLVVATQNIHCDMVHGRNMFIQGSRDDLPSVGMGQELEKKFGHTWLDLPSRGIIDLSPNLAPEFPTKWRSLNFGGILCDEWLPANEGKLIKCTSALAYKSAMAEASHAVGGVIAVYFEQRREKVTFERWIEAAQKIESPLSDIVYQEHGLLAYLSAAAHLINFAGGRSQPLEECLTVRLGNL